MLDIFDNDAFSMVNLTDAVNEVKFVPGRIGQMGIFATSGITTTKVAIERKGSQLILIPPTPRGGPGNTIAKTRRSMLSIDVPHFEVNDAIYADEVQGVRAWGSETDVEMLQDRIAERDFEIQSSFSATEEYARMGAIKGDITYVDGSELNLFTLFGVVKQPTYNLALTAATDTGALRKLCAQITKDMSDKLDGIPFSYVHALCGFNLFQYLISNLEVRNSYKNTPMAQVLREGYLSPAGSKIYGAFEFGGIVWEAYRGSVDGTDFIETDQAHLFPMGVPGLFRTVYAPADLIGATNTVGKRLYQRQYDMQNGKGRHLDTQMNALNYCTRPATLFQAKTA